MSEADSNGGLAKRAARAFERFKKDPPGKRFVKLYERRREKAKGTAATLLISTAGIVLIVGGFLLGFVPGAPGIVLAVLGAGLISTRSRRMAAWLDWGEVSSRRIWRRFLGS